MPKEGSTYESRPALPADSRALDPKLVVAEAFMTLFRDELYEEALAAGDTELRDALLYLTFSHLLDKAEVQRADIERTTRLTKTIAERVIEDRRERKRQEEIYGGPNWRGKREKAEYDLRKRAGQESAA